VDGQAVSVSDVGGNGSGTVFVGLVGGRRDVGTKIKNVRTD